MAINHVVIDSNQELPRVMQE